MIFRVHKGYRNCDSANNEEILAQIFYSNLGFVCRNNIFVSLPKCRCIYKKTSIEGIELSDGRNVQDNSTGWVCSIECGLSVYSHFLVLIYAIYALACLERFCQIPYWGY